MIQSKSLHPALIIALGCALMLIGVLGSVFLAPLVHPTISISTMVLGIVFSAVVISRLPEPVRPQTARRNSKEEEPVNWDLISRNIEEVHTYPCTLGDRVRAIEEVYNAVRRELQYCREEGRRTELEAESQRLQRQLQQIQAYEQNRQQNEANRLAIAAVAELADILVKQRKQEEAVRELEIEARQKAAETRVPASQRESVEVVDESNLELATAGE